ncbi:MAG: flippase-like domain-containing protein [Coriobacteriales bacterium]|nr:flippase-like domain-containing protein [Coriobacteriales bacterium]
MARKAVRSKKGYKLRFNASKGTLETHSVHEELNQNPDEQNAKRQKRMLYLGILFILAVVVAFIIWLMVSGKATEFADALKAANPVWLILGFSCFIVFYLLDMLCYRLSALLTGKRLGFFDVASVAAAGIVFGYLTPGQMGAAPAQIVRFNRVGLSVGDATAVQLTRFFIYQAAVTLFGAAVLIARFSYFESLFGQVVLLSIFSFGVHILIMAGLVGVIFFPNVIRRAGHFCIKLLSGRFPLIRDPQVMHTWLDLQVDEYAGAVHNAVRHAKVVASAVVITIVQLMFYYTIPYCVVCALGMTDADFLTCLCSAAFVQLIMTAIPLPGGTGGAEGGFAVFFKPILGDLTTVGVVLWRMLSFYLPILFADPQLGLRSKLSPSERLETYGEAHVGVEGIKDDLYFAKKKTADIRNAAGERVKLARMRTGDKVYVAIRKPAAEISPQTTPQEVQALTPKGAAAQKRRRMRVKPKSTKTGKITYDSLTK